MCDDGGRGLGPLKPLGVPDCRQFKARSAVGRIEPFAHLDERPVA
jgi:hypothetical protein